MSLKTGSRFTDLAQLAKISKDWGGPEPVGVVGVVDPTDACAGGASNGISRLAAVA